MKIIYFGKWTRGVACLEALLKSRHEVSAVVAQMETQEPSCAAFAESRGLTVFTPKDVNAPEFVEALKPFDAELFVLAGYTKLLKSEIIKLPRQGSINLHGGRLPDYRGASVLNWQIINGEKQIGLSIIEVAEGLDTGDIFAEETFELPSGENIAYVVKKSLEIFPRMLVETLDKIEAGSAVRKKQDLSLGKTYAKRRPEDGRIFWRRMKAEAIVNLVRALADPYPGAFGYWDDRKLIVSKASVFEGICGGLPGNIVQVLPTGLLVRAQDKGILLEEVKIDKDLPPISAAEFFKQKEFDSCESPVTQSLT